MNNEKEIQLLKEQLNRCGKPITIKSIFVMLGIAAATLFFTNYFLISFPIGAITFISYFGKKFYNTLKREKIIDEIEELGGTVMKDNTKKKKIFSKIKGEFNKKKNTMKHKKEKQGKFSKLKNNISTKINNIKEARQKKKEQKLASKNNDSISDEIVEDIENNQIDSINEIENKLDEIIEQKEELIDLKNRIIKGSYALNKNEIIQDRVNGKEISEYYEKQKVMRKVA